MKISFNLFFSTLTTITFSVDTKSNQTKNSKLFLVVTFLFSIIRFQFYFLHNNYVHTREAPNS